jgi:hypothetical protein
MSHRPNQRSTNLAHRLIATAQQLLVTASEALDAEMHRDHTELTNAQNRCLDAISAIREFQRRITIVEKKGQRG